MRTLILTFGTRGDVQPYVALGVGLRAAGHAVTIATTDEFESLVAGHGLTFARLRGDFLKLAQASDGQRPNLLKLLPQWIAMARDTLDDEWRAAQSAEVLIYNPSAFGGEHIAAKLQAPAFAAFPAPLYTPTRAFPSPFFPFARLGPFNRASHRLLTVMATAIYGRPIREWRRDVLGLPPARGETLVRGRPIPMLYSFSEAVVPRPADWPAHVTITGYWFLDAPPAWEPPSDLVAFLEAGPPPVYVGFGSMFMAGGAGLTRIVLDALARTGQRAVIATGWGGLTAEAAPDCIHFVADAPHDWVFPRVAAVVHHGGAGTTAAGLRAGRPTLICPVVGDQTFWGRRVAALGAGPAPLSNARLTPERLAAALTQAAGDPAMRERAAAVGQRLQAEDGLARAIEVIHANLNP